MKNFLKIFKRTPKETKQGSSLREALKNKYLTFERLLTENNRVLTLMADMEEKLSGEYLFDRHYINANTRAIGDGVLKIIEYINIISNNKYMHLYKIFNDINAAIEKVLVHKLEIPISDLTVPLETLNKEMTNIAGGKIAHLGEIRNNLRLLTPDGFSISAYAFKRFLGHNRLAEKINGRLTTLDINNLEETNKISKEMQGMVVSAEIPEDLQNAVNDAVKSLKLKVEYLKAEGTPPNPPTDKRGPAHLNPPLNKGGQGGVMFSVRSSAVREDGEFSFAGQYATFLNVPEDLILQRYKEVIASLFTPRAIFYYKTKGFSEDEIIMAVGVLQMVDAKAGGVMYTRDPNDPESDKIIINALWGLGKSVVDGEQTPHSYVISREANTILEKNLAEQQTMLICTPKGDIKDVAIPDELKGRQCLTDEQIKILSDFASALEKHYGKPQDIEWAIDHDDRAFILQSRPLRTSCAPSSKLQIPRRVEGYKILFDKGVVACKGIGYGNAFVLKDEEDLKDFPTGAVLVARHTSTKFVTIMNKARAIITDVGGATGHMASLAREYQVPTILDVEKATNIIKDGQEITVDAVNCNIYEGKVNELLAFNIQHSTFKETHLFKTLEKILKLIVPLSLIDPDNENFKPEHCKTLHDITRFAHEMAMAEIFKTGKGEAIDSIEDLMSAIAFAEADEAKRLGTQTSALRAGIPIDAHLLDIDGGLKTNLRKVAPEDIVSIPFSAFLKGMINMRWPEPRPVDAKGFLGMIAHTATISEDELHKAGGKSYAIVSSNYMNFSIRLGYHFSMVEAYAGENINDNYIKFFFKGGGAVSDRRLRRVRLIKEILKKIDFRVNVKEDVIDAMLTKYKQSAIEERLEVMGKLTAYTKQLDMVMYNDAVTDMFIEDFVRDHIKIVHS